MLRQADLILTCARLTEDTRADAAKALFYRNQVMVTVSRIVVGMGEPEDWAKGRIRGGGLEIVWPMRKRKENRSFWILSGEDFE